MGWARCWRNTCALVDIPSRQSVGGSLASQARNPLPQRPIFLLVRASNLPALRHNRTDSGTRTRNELHVLWQALRLGANEHYDFVGGGSNIVRSPRTHQETPTGSGGVDPPLLIDLGGADHRQASTSVPTHHRAKDVFHIR